MAKLTKDYNLKALYPDIAKEWHPTKNGDLTPSNVFPFSNKRVWWKCKFNHEWKTVIANRVNGNKCPYCVGTKVGYGNDLQTLNPDLAKEWHPTKNGDLTPKEVRPQSNKKVWWKCKFNHEWEAVIGSRYKGNNCFYCSHPTSKPELYIYSELKYIFKSVKNRFRIEKNELDIYIKKLKVGIEYDGSFYHKKKYKKDKAKNKFFEKKGIKVYRVRVKPLKKISNYDLIVEDSLSYYDLTKSLLNHLLIFESFGSSDLEKIKKYLKINKPQNENYFNKQLLYLPGPREEDSLLFNHPDIAKEWHPTKNKGLTPSDFSRRSAQKAWWVCKKGHEWSDSIGHRTDSKVKRGCPFCSHHQVGYGNDLQTLNPDLAKEWHPTKNGDLTPKEVRPQSNKKVWWKCKFNHEWEAFISNRFKGFNCPQCSNSNFKRKFDVHKDCKKIGEWISQNQCARDLNLSVSHINRCLHNKRKSHKGYTFKYCKKNDA